MANPPERNSAPVAMDKMAKKIGRFALTAIVSKRARDVKERQNRGPQAEVPDSPVIVAINDILRGRVKIVKEPDRQPVKK